MHLYQPERRPESRGDGVVDIAVGIAIGRVSLREGFPKERGRADY